MLKQTAFRLTDERLAALDKIAAMLPKSPPSSRSPGGMPATRTDALNYLIDKEAETMTAPQDQFGAGSR